VSSDLWLGAITTLSGAVLGGAISFVLSRQQIKEARVQRAQDASRERHRRSLDRRIDAYADFYTRARSFRNALRPGQQVVPRLTADEIGALARSAHGASSLVFLLVESPRTRDACREVVLAMSDAQGVIDDHDSPPPDKPWPALNERMAIMLREFQAAARAELEVDGSADETSAARL
jgi:HAMP domain-containing protein